MQTLRKYIENAQKDKVAIGHFNISNIETLWAIFHAAKSLGLPVIIGLSEGERDFFGAAQAVAMVKSLREEFNYPIFINADHSYSFEKVKEAVDAGFDAVIFDGAQLSLEKNIEETKKCVQYAREVNPEILVEGELGFIGQSSKIIEAMPSGVSPQTQTKPEDAEYFVRETDVDLFAPSVGNIHGIVKTGNPQLNIERIKALSQAAKVPLVLHGGSGISDSDFIKAIQAGISIIHINTEIRIAYQRALKLSLQENPEETTPYKIMKPVVKEIQKVVEKRLKLFNNL